MEVRQRIFKSPESALRGHKNIVSYVLTREYDLTQILNDTINQK